MDEKKVREAIEVLQREIATLEAQKDWDEYGQPLYNETLDEIIKYYETAIEALEKQLPKKPIDKRRVKDNDTIYGYVGICPSCNGIVDDSMIVCDCTQVLDWSE